MIKLDRERPGQAGTGRDRQGQAGTGSSIPRQPECGLSKTEKGWTSSFAVKSKLSLVTFNQCKFMKNPAWAGG